ncbi:MAG TPA: hypothetical protein VKB38_11690 [Terracidiphilus sp.]|nr:hypothetical protein [Terracidiphilus sp.]
MIGRIWNWFFGCRHRELSRAFTSEGETYKVCLKCGAHLPYSWETMSIVDRKKDRKNAREKDQGNLAKNRSR